AVPRSKDLFISAKDLFPRPGLAVGSYWPCRKKTCGELRPPDVQAIFCRRRHQPRRPPLAKIRPGRPAPAMGAGTGGWSNTVVSMNAPTSPCGGPALQENANISVILNDGLGRTPVSVTLSVRIVSLKTSCPITVPPPTNGPQKGFGVLHTRTCDVTV